MRVSGDNTIRDRGYNIGLQFSYSQEEKIAIPGRLRSSRPPRNFSIRFNSYTQLEQSLLIFNTSFLCPAGMHRPDITKEHCKVSYTLPGSSTGLGVSSELLFFIERNNAGLV